MQNKPAYLDLPDLTSEAAAFAARWWTDQLKGPSWNNGEPLHGIFGRMLQDASKKNLVEEDFATFEEILRTEMIAPTKLGEHEIGEYAPRPGTISYQRAHQRVDYHPGGVLRDALEVFDERVKAERPKASRSLENMFPVKTDCYISPVAVATALGYGAQREVAWKAYESVSTDEYRVVDRLYSGRYSYSWKNESSAGELAYVTLDKEAVEPTLVFLKLRGYALANCYARELDEPLALCGNIAYAFSTAVEPGYLALIEKR